MKSKFSKPLLISVPIFLGLFLLLLYNNRPQTQIDFNAHVKPILNKHCINCHGGVKKNGGFSVLFASEAFQPTESGVPAIVKGDAKNSPLIQRLSAADPEERMPYKKPPLDAAEIKILSDWIDQGAEWGTHWAYIPPKKSELPKLNNKAAPSFEHFFQTPVDAFIAARMEDQNLTPNPPAPAPTLARRVAFDLTGLPPNKELFEAYTNNRISYATYVDSLLNDTAYGEKWASWWLDLARYADTKGYEKDPGRSIWLYRDWVINALNQDLPYDQFTIDQLAGDLLPDPSPEQFIATGFHRNTMNNDEGGTSDEEFRTASVIDRVNTTFSVWQNTTMECVQCHSHPYDPFKHQEYYGLMAFFNNTRDEDTPDEAPNYRNYSKEDALKVEELLQWIKSYGTAAEYETFKDFLYFLEPKYQLHNCEDFTNGAMADGKWLALWDKGSAYLRNVDTQQSGSLYFNYFSRLNGTRMTLREKNASGRILAEFTINKSNGAIRRVPFKILEGKTDLYIETHNEGLAPQTTTSYLSWFAFLPDLPGADQKGYTKMQQRLNTLLNSPVDQTPILIENPPYMQRSTQLFERGNWQVKADTIPPHTPVYLNPWQEKWEKNRLGLAQWLVSEENPLTARTLVNRVWNQIFGIGLVPTIEDIGSQSTAPTHPALLDNLAVQFMTDFQWQLKPLIRQIVLSGTYRQSAAIDEEKLALDPENYLYVRGPKLRLTAEEIRDQALFVSGLMSRKMGGQGVMPPQPKGIWAHPYLGDLWKESKGEDRYRRAIYTYFKRTSPYPSLITFDAGSREVCLINRISTNTPLQALVTLNDPVYMEAALALAQQEENNPSPAVAIDNMYQKALYIKPDAATQTVLLDLYQQALRTYETRPEQLEQFLDRETPTQKKLAALTLVANAIMNLDAFLTHS